jgi:hypothetical protein
MATTPNYGWVMPDPTDFVTSLPADFEIFGDAVDATVDGIDNRVTDLEVITTEGDLIVGDASGDPVRLPIGALGTVLTSDGDTAEWAAASAGALSLELLNTGGTALTGAASITVNVASKDHYVLFVPGASSANASSVFTLRINGDTGGNYRYQGLQLTNNATPARVQQIGASSLAIGTMGNSASADVKFTVFVNGGAGSGIKSLNTFSGGDTGTTDVAYSIGGSWDNAAAITSFTLISSTGNFDSGTLFIYGG